MSDNLENWCEMQRIKERLFNVRTQLENPKRKCSIVRLEQEEEWLVHQLNYFGEYTDKTEVLHGDMP